MYTYRQTPPINMHAYSRTHTQPDPIMRWCLCDLWHPQFCIPQSNSESINQSSVISQSVKLRWACSGSACAQDVLQNTVGGGKPKMKYHFDRFGWPAPQQGQVPASDKELSDLIDALQVSARDAGHNHEGGKY